LDRPSAAAPRGGRLAPLAEDPLITPIGHVTEALPPHHGAAADILEKPCPRGDRNDEQREQPPSTANHRNTSDSTSGQETPLAIALLDRTVHAIGREIPRAQLQRALWTHDVDPRPIHHRPPPGTERRLQRGPAVRGDDRDDLVGAAGGERFDGEIVAQPAVEQPLASDTDRSPVERRQEA